MKNKKLILILVPILVVGTGIFVKEIRDNQSATTSETLEPYNIQAGAYRRYPPSRPGRICGLLEIEDAKKITGLPEISLFEFNRSPK